MHNAFLILCWFGLLLGPQTSFAGVISFAEAEAFLAEMKSEIIPHPNRPPLFNHYYRSQKDSPTAIVFLPGMGESSLKYYDLARDLREVPATVYMWDHIGHGKSSHLLPDEKIKIHIDSFDTHISALENFLRLLKKKHKKVLVIAHSMGGHLALRLADKHPELIHRMVLSAPLIDLNRTTLPLHYVSWLFHYLPGNFYPPLYFIYKQNQDHGSYITKSVERLQVLEQIVKKYPDHYREGATMGWILAALQSITALQSTDVAKITTPTLILQAETDYLVSNSAQDEICKKMPACQIKIIKGSLHEIFFENNPARQQAFEAALTFLKKD